MSQANWMLEETIDRSREIAEARSQLKQFAEQQGVRPIHDASELQGSPTPDDAGNDDVDDLLRLLNEWRDEDLARGGD